MFYVLWVILSLFIGAKIINFLETTNTLLNKYVLIHILLYLCIYETFISASACLHSAGRSYGLVWQDHHHQRTAAGVLSRIVLRPAPRLCHGCAAPAPPSAVASGSHDDGLRRTVGRSLGVLLRQHQDGKRVHRCSVLRPRGILHRYH